jgi:hypothetical protein
LRDPAAVLRARHTKHIAQHPEERGAAVYIDVMCRTVDSDGKSHGEPLGFEESGLAKCEAKACTAGTKKFTFTNNTTSGNEGPHTFAC